MTTMLKYIDVRQTVSLDLSRDNKDKWLKLTNKYYCGKDMLPVDEQASQTHKDAHWSVNACRLVELTIRMYEDGSSEVISSATKYPLVPTSG